MTAALCRLTGVWEQDRVDLDQVRPLVGLGLAAVLCAVLTAVAASGTALGDLFHSGRPIAGVTAQHRVGPGLQGEPTRVRVPVELRARPFGVVLPAVPASGTDRATAGEAARPVGVSSSDARPGGARARSSASRRDVPPRGVDPISPRSVPALR